MHRSTFSLLALLAFVPPLAAGEHDGSICDWVLEQTAAQSILGTPVRNFLAKQTALFEIMNGKASFDDQTAPYRNFYAEGSDEPMKSFDFITERAITPNESASDHQDVCIRIDGKLSDNTTSKGSFSEKLTFRDKRVVPVTLFVYDSGVFAQDARSGTGWNETNVRVKVGSLDLVPGTSMPGNLNGMNDPFRTFYLSAYLKSRLDTITGSASSDGTQSSKGEHVWFVGDIGDGPQLLAAICDGQCIDWQRPLVELPQYQGSTEIAGPDTSREPDDIMSEREITTISISNFAGERLILRDLTANQEIGSSLLEEETADMSGYDRAIVKASLEDILGRTEASGALDDLSDLGLISIELEDWEFDDYERHHVITLRPTEPERLTAVRLKLSKPPSRSVLQNCTPKVEITHADYDKTVHDMALNFESKIGDTYTEFEVKFEGDEPVHSVLAQSPATLSLRIFIDHDSDNVPTCRLIWNGIFPEEAFQLVESAAVVPGRFSLTNAGVAVFTDVELVSTQRAAYILIFNKIGPVDENGQPASAEAYPNWNFEVGGNELAEALTRFMRAAHAAYSGRTSAVFTLTGADSGGKDFGAARPLIDDHVRSKKVVPLLKGRLGVDSLDIAINGAYQRQNQPPIIVVIGRSGLAPDSDYCASAPPIPLTAHKDSVVIDFVPQAAVSALPRATLASLNPGSDSELSDDIIRLMPAARCPKSGPDEFDHWILVPDSKILGWPQALDSLANYIFAGTQ